jgi:hypothetical protein
VPRDNASEHHQAMSTYSIPMSALLTGARIESSPSLLQKFRAHQVRTKRQHHHTETSTHASTRQSVASSVAAETPPIVPTLSSMLDPMDALQLRRSGSIISGLRQQQTIQDSPELANHGLAGATGGAQQPGPGGHDDGNSMFHAMSTLDRPASPRPPLRIKQGRAKERRSVMAEWGFQSAATAEQLLLRRQRARQGGAHRRLDNRYADPAARLKVRFTRHTASAPPGHAMAEEIASAHCAHGDNVAQVVRLQLKSWSTPVHTAIQYLLQSERFLPLCASSPDAYQHARAGASGTANDM